MREDVYGVVQISSQIIYIPIYYSHLGPKGNSFRTLRFWFSAMRNGKLSAHWNVINCIWRVLAAISTVRLCLIYNLVNRWGLICVFQQPPYTSTQAIFVIANSFLFICCCVHRFPKMGSAVGTISGVIRYDLALAGVWIGSYHPDRVASSMMQG